MKGLAACCALTIGSVGDRQSVDGLWGLGPVGFQMTVHLGGAAQALLVADLAG